MSAKQVLIFILGIIFALGVLWLVFPADGIAAGPVTVRYASYRRSLADAKLAKVNVDSVLRGVDARFRMEDDTLHYYRTFFYENPDRIYLPEDDFRFFDPLFRQLEQAREHEKNVRILHYGDSQIEMDRISQDLRDGLQERFGGMGTGFFPALSNVPSASVSKSASGAFVQYTMYGDSTTVRAGHNRYGLLAQVVQLSGGGTVTLRASKSKYAKERTKEFTTVFLPSRTESFRPDKGKCRNLRHQRRRRRRSGGGQRSPSRLFGDHFHPHLQAAHAGKPGHDGYPADYPAVWRKLYARYPEYPHH